MPTVQKGDTLIVPTPNSSAQQVVIEWSQSFSNRTANYYALVAKNEKDKTDVVFFIQAEYYNDDHLSKVGKKAADGYEVKLDDKFQYGQADATGKGRFIVFHDKGRKPYQHRFVKTTLASKASSAANTMAKAIGGPSAVAADLIFSIGDNIFGDYLHTF